MSGYALDSLWSNRSSDCRVQVAVAKRRPRARFRFTYRSKMGARAEENAAGAVIALPPLRLASCPELQEQLPAGPRSPTADTPMCYPPYDAQKCHRLFVAGFHF